MKRKALSENKPIKSIKSNQSATEEDGREVEELNMTVKLLFVFISSQ